MTLGTMDKGSLFWKEAPWKKKPMEVAEVMGWCECVCVCDVY